MDYLAKAPRLPRDADYPTLGPFASNVARGEAYYLAAKKLWETINGSRDTPYPDSLVFPVLFLLHHFLELELKEVIRATFSIGTMIGKEQMKPVTYTHDLTQLLPDVDSNLESLGMNNPGPLGDNSRDMILDLGKFSSKGEALRYAYDTKGRPTLPTYYVINMRAVMDVMAETWIELGGAIGLLRDREDAEADMRSQCG